MEQPDFAKVIAMALSKRDIYLLSSLEQETLENKVLVGKQLSETTSKSDKKNEAKFSTQQQLELLLSNLLKYGVLISSAIVLIGGIFYLIRHGSEAVNYRVFQGEPTAFCSPVGIVKAVLSGSRRGLIQLGLLVLVATPIVRVIISLLTFLRMRDFIYAIISFLVLSGLVYSLVGAYY
jgi:uncharacterized membrane protein